MTEKAATRGRKTRLSVALRIKTPSTAWICRSPAGGLQAGRRSARRCCAIIRSLGNDSPSCMYGALNEHPPLRGKVAAAVHATDDGGTNATNARQSSGTVVIGLCFRAGTYAVAGKTLVRGRRDPGNR